MIFTLMIIVCLLLVVWLAAKVITYSVTRFKRREARRRMLRDLRSLYGESYVTNYHEVYDRLIRNSSLYRVPLEYFKTNEAELRGRTQIAIEKQLVHAQLEVEKLNARFQKLEKMDQKHADVNTEMRFVCAQLDALESEVKVLEASLTHFQPVVEEPAVTHNDCVPKT